MKAHDVIAAIMERHPQTLRVEIAEVFDIEEITVRRLIKSAGLPPAQKRTMQRARDPKLMREIRQFADDFCGGKVEIIGIPCEMPALCISGKYVS